MRLLCLHDKEEIEDFLRKDIYLHIYSLGDLDDFFWPFTLWYGLEDEAGLCAVALLYLGQTLPTLLGLSATPKPMIQLIEAMEHLLPREFYAHLSPGVESYLTTNWNLESQGAHHKMALRDRDAPAAVDCTGVVPLGSDDLDEILDFYQRSYPGNWFDPRMLETGQYFGVREEADLVSIAGIHVYSPKYRVAALGNVATSPARRNMGYARRVTAKLCTSLSREVDHVGLNVRADNASALACYRELGFETVASYGEFLVTAK